MTGYDWRTIVRRISNGEGVTIYDREILADQMLQDAITDTSLNLLILQAIENIEKTHAVGSPKWQACMRLLEGDTCYEFAKMESGVNDGPPGNVLHEFLYEADSDVPPHIITHGRDEPEELCWAEWPTEDEEAAA